MQWVPFTVALPAGLECRGMLYDEVDHFRFEYHLLDSKNGTVSKATPKQLKLAVSHIESVNLVKGWQGQKWSGVRLIIEVNSVEALSDFPGISRNRIELCVSKANVPLSEAFVNGLYSNLATSA